MMKFLYSGILFAGCTFSAVAQSPKEPVKITDMLKIKTAGAVTISKDGSKAAFNVMTIEPDGDSKTDFKYNTQVWMVPTDGSSQPRQLTSRESAMQPAWSPDGRQLAFVRAADGKSQIFLLSLDGGEAVQLTKFKYGAAAPVWSPDGKQLLFAASVPFKDLLKDAELNPGKQSPRWPAEKPGFAKNEQLTAAEVKADPDGSLDEVRAYLDNNANDRKARIFNKLNFLDETNISSDMSFNHYFVVNAVAGATPVAITKGFYRFNGAGFTPDGKQLLLAGDVDSLEHPDRSLESQLFLVNTNGTNFRKVLGEDGKVYSNPRISPSGKWIAFQHGTTSFVNVPALAIMPLNGTAKDIVDIPFDRNKGTVTWSADEQFLYFTAQSNGGMPLYRADIKSRKVDQLTDYNSGISSFDITGNKLVYVKAEVANPFELYLADAAAKNPKRISNFNEWVNNKLISQPEKKTFTNSKGMTVEYWVMKPANYVAGKKYPVVLEIHGGPSAMWGPGESSMWHEFQYFCSKGYGVVYCNPRGSGGYGVDFLRGNINDWGAGPSSDVLTALDKAVAEGWADTSRLTITGGSYAGYLVAWIIAHDQRFKAACSQRGVYDLATFFGEGNAWRLVPNYFGGYPWEPATKAILERESPINYVQNMHTPYIVFHGDNDRRTGFVQSEMLYHSLKALGRPVEYVRHPNATHEITRSGDNRQRIDQLLRTWEFFQRYIQ
ncbi:S9 family peptidase [Paraflavitalea sp. CAU 1676]|uniref:S9 family peptidase n=1 Tax=Paraflavitalea sp. CAU 1676 TaxID=3032598 RepID=UPI0023D9D86B|nr:S9 family peptidase [Paraflavitalea sp. CAU 1676]MDF2190874.1 S9 family peptidase [Paraflavitalea sp. CAU 1676]